MYLTALPGETDTISLPGEIDIIPLPGEIDIIPLPVSWDPNIIPSILLILLLYKLLKIKNPKEEPTDVFLMHGRLIDRDNLLMYRYLIDRNDSEGIVLRMLYRGIPNTNVIQIRHRNLDRVWHAILIREDNPLPTTYSIYHRFRYDPIFIAYIQRLPILNLFTNCYTEGVFKYPNINVLRALGEGVNIWTYGMRGETVRVNLTGEIFLPDQSAPLRGRILVVSTVSFHYTLATLA